MELLRMSPRRPYLLRAYYEWLLDNNMTPYLVVDVNISGVNVPMKSVNKGQIVLNIKPSAVNGLELTNKIISFNARFSGIPRYVEVPIGAIIAIYGRENGVGMMFEPEPAYNKDDISNYIAQGENLVLISNTELSNKTQKVTPILSSDDEPPPMPPKKGRPTLRVIK